MTPEQEQERFSRRYLRALRRAGSGQGWVYDPSEFALRCESHTVYLANVYDEWRKASLWRRGRLLRTYVEALVTAPGDMPDAFEDARAHLMLRIRDLPSLETLRRQLGEDRTGVLSYHRLNDDLAIELVYDLPRAVQSVNRARLEAWGVSLDDAMRIARHNLRMSTTGTFARVTPAHGPGVYAAAWGDSYDATRLVLTELVARLDIQGDPVAVVPHRDHLFVTGSDDVAGLGLLARLAEEQLHEQRWLSGRAFVHRNGGWQRWMPPADHEHEHAFGRLMRLTVGASYEEQKALLDAEPDRAAADVFVASVLLIADAGSDAVRTLTTWAQGVTALLPRTDSVAFGPLADGGHLEVPWSRVEAVLGAELEPQGLTPERYLVKRFPTSEELERLAAR
jgi:hypothetical protein